MKTIILRKVELVRRSFGSKPWTVFSRWSTISYRCVYL